MQLKLTSICKRTVPVNVVEKHKALRGRNIHDTSLVHEYDTGDALQIPEQLIDVVVSDNTMVITFSPYKLAIHRWEVGRKRRKTVVA
jgi:hypothetical protein